SIDRLDPGTQELIAGRLEMRAALPRFVELRDEYFELIDLSSSGGDVLEIGCGTGPVCRAI
ncbi:MAG: hypothetical protein GWO02_17300, partial [Gammaproteobacteria bacterium]|nr:hypothetical protein [Gammaproteobacteria bacterium]